MQYKRVILIAALAGVLLGWLNGSVGAQVLGNSVASGLSTGNLYAQRGSNSLANFRTYSSGISARTDYARGANPLAYNNRAGRGLGGSGAGRTTSRLPRLGAGSTRIWPQRMLGRSSRLLASKATMLSSGAVTQGRIFAVEQELGPVQPVYTGGQQLMEKLGSIDTIDTLVQPDFYFNTEPLGATSKLGRRGITARKSISGRRRISIGNNKLRGMKVSDRRKRNSILGQFMGR